MPAALPISLPGYVWDARLRGGRWRHLLPDGRLGKLVSAREMAADIRAIAKRSVAHFGNLAADVVAGRITARAFYETTRGELKALYLANAALGRGGWGRMGPVEWGRIGGILRGEYRYLAGFAKDLADGKLTEAQAQARAALYVGKAYSRYWDEDRRRKQEGGYREESWRDTGDERECSSCPVLAAQGWVPIGSLNTVPGAGDTECLGACRCEITYR